MPADACYCSGWYFSKGNDFQGQFADIMQWICFVGSLLIFFWQCWVAFKHGINVASYELMLLTSGTAFFYAWYIWYQFESPVMAYMITGNMWNLWQYQSWVWLTPITLFYVADMSGRHDSFTRANVHMILHDVIGFSSYSMNGAAANFWVKLAASLFSAANIVTVFYLAFNCFQQTKREMTTNRARRMVSIGMIIFYIGWNLHTLGGGGSWEGLGFFNPLQTQIVNSFADIGCKLVFSIWGTYFRLMLIKDLPAEKPDTMAGANAAPTLPPPPPRNAKAMMMDEDEDMEYAMGRSKGRAGSVKDDDVMSQMSYNPGGMAMPAISPQRANPLYSGAGQPNGSPLASMNMNMAMTSPLYSPAQAPAPVNQEQIMMANLMAEINRLKTELQ